MAEYLSPLAEPFDFPAGEHGVLLLHGFTGSPAHMRKLGEALSARGFAARGILLPGHGTRYEDMRGCTWQDWLLASRMAAREMRERYARFSVAGLSMGGVLALLLAEEMDLTACVSIAAPMKTANRFAPFAPLAAPFYPTVHKRADGSRATLDARYDVGYQAFPTASVRHLNALMRRARQHLGLIRCPLLAVQSHADKTVTPDSPCIILSGARSAVKAQLWLDEAPHVCTISPEWGKIADAMEAFLHRAEQTRAE